MSKQQENIKISRLISEAKKNLSRNEKHIN